MRMWLHARARVHTGDTLKHSTTLTAPRWAFCFLMLCSVPFPHFCVVSAQGGRATPKQACGCSWHSGV